MATACDDRLERKQIATFGLKQWPNWGFTLARGGNPLPMAILDRFSKTGAKYDVCELLTSDPAGRHQMGGGGLTLGRQINPIFFRVGLETRAKCNHTPTHRFETAWVGGGPPAWGVRLPTDCGPRMTNVPGEKDDGPRSPQVGGVADNSSGWWSGLGLPSWEGGGGQGAGNVGLLGKKRRQGFKPANEIRESNPGLEVAGGKKAAEWEGPTPPPMGGFPSGLSDGLGGGGKTSGPLRTLRWGMPMPLMEAGNVLVAHPEKFHSPPKYLPPPNY